MGPLFRRSNRDPLTKIWLVTEVRRALASLGLCQANYAAHSFRIGAATVAAAAGIADSTIQALRRWSSAAFLSYIRILREYLDQTSRQLAALSESPIPADPYQIRLRQPRAHAGMRTQFSRSSRYLGGKVVTFPWTSVGVGSLLP